MRIKQTNIPCPRLRAGEPLGGRRCPGWLEWWPAELAGNLAAVPEHICPVCHHTEALLSGRLTRPVNWTVTK